MPFELVDISPLLSRAVNSLKPLTTDVLSNQVGLFLISKVVLSKFNPLYATKTESATKTETTEVDDLFALTLIPDHILLDKALNSAKESDD